jgi:hypothetical protein
MRRARKLCLRLGGDPTDDRHPDKPKRMRWKTYNRLMNKLVAADDVADGRLVLLAARLLGPAESPAERTPERGRAKRKLPARLLHRGSDGRTAGRKGAAA